MKHHICPADSGDLIIILPSPTVEVTIKVSTKLLISASKYFASMLTGQFVESHKICTSEEPGEITLPDVDQDAAMAILRLIHHKSPDTKSHEFGSLLSITALAVFWQREEAIRSFVTGEVAMQLLIDRDPSPSNSISSGSCFADAIVTSYVFDDEQLFVQLTRYVLMRGNVDVKKPDWMNVCEKLEHLAPATVWGKPNHRERFPSFCLTVGRTTSVETDGRTI